MTWSDLWFKRITLAAVWRINCRGSRETSKETMAVVQQTDGGLDHVATMTMVRSGQILDIAMRLTEGLDVGFQRKEYKMTPRLLASK